MRKSDEGLEKKHLHHLDALRTFAMLFGVFVHAGTLKSSPVFEGIATFSDHFRMALFFMVSGALAALVLSTRPIRTYITRRLFSLIVPFAFVVIVFNPITIAMIARWHGYTGGGSLQAAVYGILGVGGRQLPPPSNWHLHLWFLVSLMIYTLAIPAIIPVIRAMCNRVEGPTKLRSNDFNVTAIMILVVAIGLAQRVVYEGWLFFFPDAWIARATLFYLPYVVLGTALTLSKSVQYSFGQIFPLFSTIGILSCILGFVILGPSQQSAPYLLLALILKYFITTLIIQFIYAISIRYFDRRIVIVEKATKAIFTLYLFHYFLIYLVANLFFTRSDIGDVGKFGIGLAVIVIGLAIHYIIVAPFGVVRMLVNGEFPKGRLPESLLGKQAQRLAIGDEKVPRS